MRAVLGNFLLWHFVRVPSLQPLFYCLSLGKSTFCVIFYHTLTLNIEHSFCALKSSVINAKRIVKRVRFLVAESWGAGVELWVFLGKYGKLWVNQT
jgi:hypothetical protein